ncbi:DHH family phosphoesterase [Anaerosporobacter faecicola]|uniref:DHH family phosphoesterase n=1 Tax=Anaerosporobacter faecicola TaxID=2718714 RepID=UPI00143B3334|nr:bifunctional oligoribonuclease/PAP phosphatase NrnA [Anaerosporobacter faecicola]
MKLLEAIKDVKTIAISGHVRPDGDCVGSCMATYHYIKENLPEVQVDVFLESVASSFGMLANLDQIHMDYRTDIKSYDLFLSLDCGSADRLGNAQPIFEQAKETICIDHHISNTKFAKENYIFPDASSTCEVLYGLFDEEKISLQTAQALYLGIVHDTGVFKHSNTSEKTMMIAGKLLSKGVSSAQIIDESFYQKTYLQNQILGRCLLESFLVLDGKCIISTLNKKTMDFYEVTSEDLDGVIDQLRVTKGVEVAVFIYETLPQEYKVSMRANGNVDVSKIAVYFGGGGHVKAAGCSLKGVMHDVINNIVRHIDIQLKNLETEEALLENK